MTKGRILEVTERKTSQGKPIFDVNVDIAGKATQFQCWDAIIKEKQGKEVEFTVKESNNAAYPTPTMMLPKGDGSSGFKKPFTNYKDSPANLAMMELSYKKDIMCKCVDISLAVSGRSDKHLDEKEISKMAVECYKVIGLPLFKHEDK